MRATGFPLTPRSPPAHRRGAARAHSRASSPAGRTNAATQPLRQPSTPASQTSCVIAQAWHGSGGVARVGQGFEGGPPGMTIRPRRSVLYMPGSNARAMEKARTLAADGIILDLEDAVAPDAKADARAQVVKAVQAGGFGHREVFVRTNGLDTPWFSDDLDAAVTARPDAVLVPKISTVQQIELIGQRL